MDLKANCLICRDSVKNYENQGFHVPWIEDTTISLCQILNLDKHFQQVLENAVYCDSCLGTVRDMGFTLKNISALQKRLENSRFRVSTLLEINYDEVSSIDPEIILSLSDMEENEDKTQSYEHVVTSIWEAMSADKKPVLTKSNINESVEITMRSRPMIPHRHKIILHEPKGLSDSDSDFESEEPKVEQEISIPTVTSRRTRSRKHSKPIKVVTKTLALREKDLKGRQKKSKEFKCDSTKCKFSTSDAVKYPKHLKKHDDKSKVSMNPAGIRVNLKQRKQKNSEADKNVQNVNEEFTIYDKDQESDDEETNSSRKRSKPKKLGRTGRYRCTKVFESSDEKEYQEHRRITFASKCDICQAVFANPHSLKRHLGDVHGHPKKSLQCDKCPFVTNHTSKFKLHMHKHSETKHFICKVDGCDKAFTWASSLRSHNRMHRTGDKKFKGSVENCTNVPSFKQTDYEETRSDCRSYLGDRCAKSFKEKKGMRQHFRRMHDEGSKTVREMRRKLPGEAVHTLVTSKIKNQETFTVSFKKRRHSAKLKK